MSPLAPVPTLQLARCTRCDAYSFPVDSPGCRCCGAPADALQPAPLPHAPRLRNVITLHAELVPGLPVPCVIGEVELAPGVIEEARIAVPDEAQARLGMELRPVAITADGGGVRWQFEPDPASDDTRGPQPQPAGVAAALAQPRPAAPASTASRLLQERAVYVVGIGMHRYQFPSETPYVQLGLVAVREALADAGLTWPQLPLAVVGTAALGMAAGRVMLRHLGSTGLEVEQVENASASGSTAFRIACLQVASGEHDLALALGVDKFGDGRRAALKDGLVPLSPTAHVPLVKFALLARRCLREYGLTLEDLASVAVKNHGNASLNPWAQFRKPRTLEQVLQAARVAGDLTGLQCTPRGEGAAAVIVASEAAMQRWKLDTSRAVRVRASVSTSEGLPESAPSDVPPIVDMVARSSAQALEAAGIGPGDLDLVELHDAFSVEELVYSEAIGICQRGEGAHYLRRGASRIGGECAVNASGGLIGMGHPLGPTGLGQVAEIVRQLRGEAEGRQHPNARLALAHMIGLGSVAVAHVLEKA